MSFNSFHDLSTSPQMDDRLAHDFLIALLDQIFGHHEGILRIDLETETDTNHGIIYLRWKLIRQYYQVPSTAKKTQKLVRQTLKHIVENLNNKYHFTQPLQFVQKRLAYRENGKVLTPTYIEFSIV